MGAFEILMATLLERKGFWVRSNFKVELTKEEKRRIGRPSSPRWELDLVAYKAATNELRIVECKSYLDSPGVKAASFITGSSDAKRYKLFHEKKLRETVLRRLVIQLEASGAITKKSKVTLCLAAAKIRNQKDRDELRNFFSKKGWILWDDERIREAIKELADSGYEDDVAAVVAKLLLR